MPAAAPGPSGGRKLLPQASRNPWGLLMQLLCLCLSAANPEVVPQRTPRDPHASAGHLSRPAAQPA